MSWFHVFRLPEGVNERGVKHPPELSIWDSRPLGSLGPLPAPRAPCGCSLTVLTPLNVDAPETRKLERCGPYGEAGVVASNRGSDSNRRPLGYESS